MVQQTAQNIMIISIFKALEEDGELPTDYLAHLKEQRNSTYEKMMKAISDEK